MSTEEKHLEIKVGAFVLVGLIFASVMVVRFGGLADGFRSYNDLTVELANASGLLKDSDVLFGGARIGYVAERPRISNDLTVLESSEGKIASTGVIVELKILSDVEIPSGSRVQIGSSGLLGDRFVDVIPPEEFGPDDFFKDGAVIAGTREAGIDDITREGTELLRQLRETVTTIDEAIKRVDQTLLGESNLQKVEVTLTNLRETSNTLKEFSNNINVLVDDARGVIGEASNAMDTVDSTLTSANEAADELVLTVSEAREAVAIAKRLIQEGLEGDGLLAKILTDEKLSSDLTSLIANLRNHGVLFYRDSAGRAVEADIIIRGDSDPSSAPRSGGRPVR